jgi:hypothetical protein
VRNQAETGALRKRLREAFPVGSRPGLYEALDVVVERYRELGQRFERYPTPLLSLQTLAEEVKALPGRTVAIEALGDGDSDGWCVDLTALTDDPAAEHRLAIIRHGSDMRLFNGSVPPGSTPCLPRWRTPMPTSTRSQSKTRSEAPGGWKPWNEGCCSASCWRFASYSF